MSVEFDDDIFFAPSRLFTDLEDSDSRKRFKGLMQFQYGFSDKEVDDQTEGLRERLYWKKVAPELLALVTNDQSKRAFQVGTLIGYSSEEFLAGFGDTYIERVGKEEVLLIHKSDISPQAGIKVKFLDGSWQDTLKEGVLTGYEEIKERNPRDPFGWYIVQVEEETLRIGDWRMLSGNTRFFVEPQES